MCAWCNIVRLHDHKGTLEVTIDEDGLSYDDKDYRVKGRDWEIAETEVTLLSAWALFCEYSVELKLAGDYFNDYDPFADMVDESI